MKKLSKLTSLFLATIMVLGVLTIAPFTVGAATYGDFEYTLEDDFTCTITKYNGYSSNVTIPSSIYGNKVTTIGWCAFENYDNLVSVTIPNSVTYIDSYAFADCSNFKNITFSNNLKEINYRAFCGCTNLTGVSFPASMTKLRSQAFADCEKLVSVTLNNGLINIENSVFRNCKSMESIVIPNSVKDIGSNTFEYCNNLKNVSMGYGVEAIGGNYCAFENCPSLETISVNYNNKNYSSADGVLYDKNKTEIIWYPQGKKTTSYTVPTGVKTLYSNTFNDNKYLKTVTIYDNVTLIEDGAFGYANGEKISGFTIKGYKGTEAEKYARNNDFNFIEIPKPIDPTSVKVNRSTLTLGVGESYGIIKTISPSNATQTCTWSSSNSSVASVDSNGKVTAKKAGTANITVKTSNGKTATCKVTVKPAPTSVKISNTSLTLGKGETFIVSQSTNSGSYANAANLKWSSTNTSVATVTKGSGNKAVITAKGVGTAYVKITLYNGKTATCKVTVKPAPTSVKLSKTSITLNKGQTYTISESTNSGTYANSANLKWSSTNTSVATVTKGSANKATITAKSKGTAYIKITLYNGKTAQCKVTVK
ncbi:MAG: leucine-rich repeat protein [Ruminococcus sp.]|nr:leucine-rich repeat protein [Ruminococcus sp.]